MPEVEGLERTMEENRDIADLLPRIRRVVAKWAAPQDVDDLTQECCVRVIQAERLWDPARGSRAAWVQTIARNLTFNHLRLRKQRREKRMEAEAAVADEQPEVAADRVRWVLEQFRYLNDEQKELLRLRYFDGMKTEDMAERLGVSQPTVSRRLSSTVEALKRGARTQGLLQRFLPVPLAGAIAGASKMKVAAMTAVLIATGFISADFFLPEDDIHVVKPTSALPGTTFCATLDTPLDPRKSTGWAATAPLAWQELTRAMGEAPRFEPELAFARRLSSSSYDRGNLLPTSYVAGAGRIDSGIIEKLQERVEKTFKRGPDPELARLAAGLPDKAMITYAFMARDLEFDYAFEAPRSGALTWSPEPLEAEGSKEVSWFGISKVNLGNPRHKKLVKQVKVEHYVSRQDFIVRLLGTKGEPDVVIARMKPGATLGETIDTARKRIEEKDPQNIFESDRLAIPKLDFHLTHQYSELSGKRLANDGYAGWPLEIVQTIRFRLDEKGARFRSRVVGALGARIMPREFIVDGPFLLLMQEKKASQPFMALWIGNSDLLIPFE